MPPDRLPVRIYRSVVQSSIWLVSVTLEDVVEPMRRSELVEELLLVGREHEEQHWRFHSPAPLAAPANCSPDYPVAGLTESGYILSSTLRQAQGTASSERRLRTKRSTLDVESDWISFVWFAIMPLGETAVPVLLLVGREHEEHQ